VFLKQVPVVPGRGPNTPGLQQMVNMNRNFDASHSPNQGQKLTLIA
jgi:hypothetical protein